MKRKYDCLRHYHVRCINGKWWVVQLCRSLWDDSIWYDTKFVQCKTRSLANQCADELDYIGWGYKEGDILAVAIKYMGYN